MAACNATWFTRLHNAIKGSVAKIKLNDVQFQRIDGRAVAIKRRNLLGRHVMPLANMFFRVVGAPVLFEPDLESWRHAEVSCFTALNPQFRAQPLGADAVCEDRLPGESLWTHLQNKTLTDPMLVAAGRELRRAHNFASERGPWSHGDAAMRNFLYDPGSGRARLIDFELRHNPRLSANRRQAEDLLSFLLDLASLTPRRRWLPQARLFLRAYGPSPALGVLRERLAVPRGLGRLWWCVRVNFAACGRIRKCLAELKRSLDREPQGRLSAASTTRTPLPIAMRRRRAHRTPTPARAG